VPSPAPVKPTNYELARAPAPLPRTAPRPPHSTTLPPLRGKAHDLGALAALGLADQPPFFWPGQMSRPQSILSDPSRRSLSGAEPPPATPAPSLLSAPSSGSADAPSDTVLTVAEDRAQEPRCAESTALRSAPCADSSTGVHARQPAHDPAANVLHDVPLLVAQIPFRRHSSLSEAVYHNESAFMR